jgi:hypothetical protein
MERTIIVGDVHGCADELENLVGECGWQPGERLVLVGDLVAKGPDSPRVVALARAWGAEAVLGNHELHVLRAHDHARGNRSLDERPPKPEHQRVAEALEATDFGYLEQLPLWIRLGPERPGDADTVVVHAGAVPNVPWERQRRKHLLSMRSIRSDGKPTKYLVVQPWAAVWRGPERIVFGHDALRGLQLYPWATGLDTGCVYGGRLTALILPERRLVSVAAQREYLSLQDDPEWQRRTGRVT